MHSRVTSEPSLQRCCTRAIAMALLAACASCTEPAGDRLPGTLERERIVLRAEQSEPVVAVAVREGQRVEAGAVLLELDPSRAQAALDEAQARRRRAQALLDEVEHGPRPEQILQARATLAEAQARLAQASEDFQRISGLFARGLASSQQRDAARASRDAASARRDAARAALDALLAGSRPEQIAQARAARDAAVAAERAAQIALSRMRITAPVAARIESLPFRVGDRPPANAPVAVLLADGRLYARVHLPQDLHARLAPGAKAEVIVPGRPTPLRGVLRFAAAEADWTPYYALTERERGNLELLIATPVRTGELMAGKIAPYVLVGYLQAGIILAAGVWLFDVPVRGSLAALAAAALFFIAASLSLGLLISTFARTQFQAMQLTVFTFLPSILLSGFMFPFDGMPRIAQWIAEVLPLSHFIRLIRGIVLRDASLFELTGALAALLAFFAVTMSLAMVRFRKRLD